MALISFRSVSRVRHHGQCDLSCLFGGRLKLALARDHRAGLERADREQYEDRSNQRGLDQGGPFFAPPKFAPGTLVRPVTKPSRTRSLVLSTASSSEIHLAWGTEAFHRRVAADRDGRRDQHQALAGHSGRAADVEIALRQINGAVENGRWRCRSSCCPCCRANSGSSKINMPASFTAWACGDARGLELRNRHPRKIDVGPSVDDETCAVLEHEHNARTGLIVLRVDVEIAAVDHVNTTGEDDIALERPGWQ